MIVLSSLTTCPARSSLRENNFGYLRMHKIANKYYLILALLLSMSAIGQEILLAPPISSGQAQTRDVNEYTFREQSIISLLENQEKPGSSLLAEDFEFWSHKGNDWQSKTDWFETETQQNHFNIRNLSVRHMDDLAVVCFLLDTTATHDKKVSTQFIVDIWRKSTNKLSARYASEVVEERKFDTTGLH